jgi:AGZA family xanthine/uracil permease-like MFS transporter
LASDRAMVGKLFRLSENGTTTGREIQAGLTTFAAMAYILAVNPQILSATGMDQAALVTATAIGAAISTLLMAFLTNYPLALAPGMGINAYFTYTVCLGLGVPWQSALGMVFINGCLFLALSVTGVRERIVNAIPYQLKIAITCGIGLFIAFIGLKNGGMIVASQATFVTHGDLGSPPVLLCFAGIILTAALVARRIPGAIVIAVIVITMAGFFVPNGSGGMVTSLPSAFFAAPASLEPLFLKLEFDWIFSNAAAAIPIIITLLFVDMFDNIGTLIGVTQRAGLLDSNGRLPKLGRALVADSSAAILSSLLGTSTVVSYIESASGVEAGGRTGLTGVTAAICFLLALVLTPLILIIPAAATAPVLVIVGVFMFQSVVHLDLKDFTLTTPAAVTILAMPLAFSISYGIGLGLITFALLMTLAKRGREVSVVTWVLAAIFFAEFTRTLLGW